MPEIDVVKTLTDRLSNVTADIKFPGWPGNHVQKVKLGTLANLRLRLIKLIPVKVDYSEVKADALPTEVLKQTYYFRNCSQSQRKQVSSATITFVEGYTITKIDYISNTFTISPILLVGRWGLISTV